MDLGLKGTVALVTGASEGIGKAIALALASEGARVAICARTAAQIEAAARDIQRATGAAVLPAVADVTKTPDLQRWVQTVQERLGPPGVLVNNATIPLYGSFETLEDTHWHQYYDVKIIGYVRCCRLVLPAMKAQRWGRVINVAGQAARLPRPAALLNGTANAALVNFTKALSTIAAPYGITVNAVHPGATATRRLGLSVAARARAAGQTREEVERATVEGIPIGRFIQPEEVAALVVFLASRQAAAITGQAIAVDGGAVPCAYY